MKKYIFGMIALLATATVFCSCDNSEYDDDFKKVQTVTNKEKNEEPASDDYIVGKKYLGEREITGENSELCSIYQIYVYNSGVEKMDPVAIATQPLYYSVNTIDLGTYEVASYGSWSASNGKLTEGEVSSKSGYTYFTVQSRVDIYSAKLSNGSLNVNSKYDLYHEGCTFTNSDTTIVFAILDYAVEELSTTCSDEGKLTNSIKATYSENVQNATETGRLYIKEAEPEEEPEEEVEDGRKFIKAAFSATPNPNNKTEWMYSASVQFEDGTLALPIAKDGTPMWSEATWWAGVKDNSLNGAYYVAKYGKWYPCIASDQNGHMEWSLCAAQGSRGLYMLDFAGADTYGDWNANDKNSRGQHTALTSRFKVKNEAKKHTLTFTYNGVEKGTYSYTSF